MPIVLYVLFFLQVFFLGGRKARKDVLTQRPYSS